MTFLGKKKTRPSVAISARVTKKVDREIDVWDLTRALNESGEKIQGSRYCWSSRRESCPNSGEITQSPYYVMLLPFENTNGSRRLMILSGF